MIVDDVRPSTSEEQGKHTRVLADEPVAGDAPVASVAEPISGQTEATAPGAPVAIEPAQVRSALEAIGGFVAQTTLLSALLYFFGYQFVDNQAQGLGLDANTLGYSTRDYVLRSFSSIVPAVGFLLLVGLVIVAIHVKIRAWVDSGRRLTLVDRLAVGMAVVGAVLLAIGLLGMRGHFEFVIPPFHDWLEDNRIMLPLSVLVGIIGMAYGIEVHRVWLSSGAEREAIRREPRWLRSLRLVIVFVLVAVNVFWAASEWAVYSGRQAAEDLIETLSELPQAVVHSKVDLGLGVAGEIRAERLTDAADGYAFRYDGVRYLTRSAGNYFLLSGSATTDVRAIVLPDNDSLWVEVLAPPLPKPPPGRQSSSPGR